MAKFGDERIGHTRRCDRLPNTHLALPREMGGSGSLTNSKQAFRAGDATVGIGTNGIGGLNAKCPLPWIIPGWTE